MKKICILIAAAAMLLHLSAKENAPVIRTVLFPFREAVISARVDSTVSRCLVKSGDAFKTGDVLVRLDDRRFRLEMEKSTGQYDFALATFRDKEQLRAKNFTSDYELKKAQFDLAMAKNVLEEAKVNLSYCTVNAPFAGKVVEILSREYETVRPGGELLKIIDDSSLLAVMNVPLNAGSLQKIGAPVRLKLGDGSIADGKVYEVSPLADHRTGTIRIRVLIQNPAGKFTAGTTGILLHGK